MNKVFFFSALACVTLSYSVQAITVKDVQTYFYTRTPESNFLLFSREGIIAEPTQELCEITEYLRENLPLDDARGTTPLDVAVQVYNYNEWLQALLGLDEYQNLKNFYRIIQEAIKEKTTPDLSSFDEQTMSQPLDAAGNTALHLAVSANRADLVQMLLEGGANPDKKNVAQDLPMTLVLRGVLKREIFDVLIEYADPNATSSLGNLFGHLLSYYKDDNAAYAMEKLVEKGMSVSTRATYGDTSLHGAAWIRNIVMVNKQKTLGADINGQNRYGQTAFHAAAINGCKATIDALLTFERINKDLVDQDGKKPSDVAANEFIAGYLRELGL